MGSHSGKREKRKAKEAERYWRLKKDYDDRITRLEERRRQIMEQLEPGSFVTDGPVHQPSLTRLRENCLRVREALEEVLQTCNGMSIGPAEKPSEVDLSEESKSPDKKNKVLVFKSDGTPKGQRKKKGETGVQIGGESLPQVTRLKNSIQLALQEIDQLLSLLGEAPGIQQVLPAETSGNQEDIDLDGMLDVLKSPMVSELVSNLLTSLKK